MSVYDLIDRHLRIQTLFSEDDLTEDEKEELELMLADCTTSIESNADGIARVVRNLAAESDAYKAESDRLAKMAQTRKNACERLKSLMLYAMQTIGADKIGTSIGTWSVQNNPKSVEIADTVNPEDLPARFTKIKTEINKTAIMDAYKAGEDLPIGCTVVQKQGVRFR